MLVSKRFAISRTIINCRFLRRVVALSPLRTGLRSHFFRPTNIYLEKRECERTVTLRGEPHEITLFLINVISVCSFQFDRMWEQNASRGNRPFLYVHRLARSVLSSLVGNRVSGKQRKNKENRAIESFLKRLAGRLPRNTATDESWLFAKSRQKITLLYVLKSRIHIDQRKLKFSTRSTDFLPWRHDLESWRQRCLGTYGLWTSEILIFIARSFPFFFYFIRLFYLYTIIVL